jgi:hypothetical protein
VATTSLRKALCQFSAVNGNHFVASFNAAQGDEAHAFRDKQVQRWLDIINSINGRLPSTPGSSNYGQLMRAYEKVLRDHETELFRLIEDDIIGTFVVTSTIPLLGIDRDELGVGSNDDIWLHIGTIVYWLSKIAIGTGELTVSPSVSFFQDPRVLRGLADAAMPDLEVAHDLIDSAHKAESMIASSEQKLHSKVQEFDAAIAKTREDGIFKSANSLWSEKAKRHTWAYTVAFLTIVLLISVFPLILSIYQINMWSLLPKNERTGEYTYLAVLIVALGFVAVAWIFRMLGRFVLDNFSLASDARQREMILRTFLTLVGTPEAKMQDGERVLILNAIFRPVPGQGPDDPAPSSLMDLMKDAFKPAGKS